VAAFPGYKQKLIELLPELEQIDAVPLKVHYTIKGQVKK
jgi:hypothetical protein